MTIPGVNRGWGHVTRSGVEGGLGRGYVLAARVAAQQKRRERQASIDVRPDPHITLAKALGVEVDAQGKVPIQELRMACVHRYDSLSPALQALVPQIMEILE